MNIEAIDDYSERLIAYTKLQNKLLNLIEPMKSELFELVKVYIKNKLQDGFDI